MDSHRPDADPSGAAPAPGGVNAPFPAPGVPMRGPGPGGLNAPIPPSGPVPIRAAVPEGVNAPIPPRGAVPSGVNAPIPPRGALPNGVNAPIPPAAPIPPRIPATAVAPPKAPRVPANYRPPSQVASKPTYVDPKILFGALGAAVLLLLALAVWKNVGRGAPVIGSTDLELRAGRDVKKNLSGSDWATLSLPSAIGKDSLLKTGSDTQNVLALADGSSIRMDKGTSVKVVSVEPSEKGQKVRLILYRGRLFVNELESSDVTVESKFVSIVPVGTRFAVSQVEQADLTEYTVVRVVEGTVRVTHLEDKAASMVVKAGEQASAGAAVLESPKVAAVADEWITWNLAWTALDQITLAPGAAAAPAAQAPPAGAPPAPGAAPGGAPAPHDAPPPNPPPGGQAPMPAPHDPPQPQHAPPPQPVMPQPVAAPPHQQVPFPNGQGAPATAREPGRQQPGPSADGATKRPLPPDIPTEDATHGGQEQGVPTDDPMKGQFGPQPAGGGTADGGATPPPGGGGFQPGAPGGGYGGFTGGGEPAVVKSHNKESYPVTAPTSNSRPPGY